MNVDQGKQELREKVWTLLEDNRAVPPDANRNIPAFVGADEAAAALSRLPIWKNANILKTVPDTAQLPVRVRALEDGKIVYMAVPRLAAPKPFYALDPDKIKVPAAEAAKKSTAARIGRNVDVDEMLPVDLVVIGSVAVNNKGVRIGKGAGYSDIELALLQEFGLITPDTPIVTTVHPLQIVDGDLPEAEHDFRVDLIVTPDGVIQCTDRRRPTGILWDSLPPEKIAAIPALAARKARLQSRQERNP
ncbi:5-formyltetrahydrofolate cyclo-ligase [Nocardia nova]|uniref:5-formyltetrahydrofolate cyclo-ligase n=1 Tax=Nocardia nova TaxID=37330 RepID=UPI0033CF3436